MKFLCVSDAVDPLIYSTSVKERYADVDAVLCAGDLSLDYQDYIVTTLGKPLFFVFGNHDLKDFGLYNKKAANQNNMTAMHIMEQSHGGDYVSNRSMVCRFLPFKLPNGSTTPLIIAGVSGSMRYNNGQDQYTEREMKWQLLKLAPVMLYNKIRYGRCCDIFLTHASPRHVHDKEDPCHKGFECFNWFINKFKPGMLIHGHIHLYDLQAIRSTKVDQTMVINAYSHLVVDYQPNFTGKKGEASGSIINILTDR